MKLTNYGLYNLVTHKGCMDGSGCAILYKVLGGQNVYYANPNHDSSDRIIRDLLIDQQKPVLAVDVSISMELADELFNQNKLTNYEFELHDHHKTAIPLLDFKSPCIHVDKENSRCGCKLLYYAILDSGIFKDKIYDYKPLINLIDDNDRWIKSYPESEDLSLFHNTFGQKKFVERFVKNPDPDLTSEEKFLVKLEKEKMEEEIEDKKKSVQSHIYNKTINGKKYRVGFVYGARYTSTTGNALCTDVALDLDFVVMVGGGNTISMRGKHQSDIDLSQLASVNKGGGHTKASGFPISSLLGMDLIEFVAEKMRFE